MGFDIKSGMIAKDFSVFLEEKLDSIFIDKEVELSRISGSIFSRLAVDDLSLYQKGPATAFLTDSDKASALVFSVDRMTIKYDLADLLLRRFDDFGGVYLISPSFVFKPGRPEGLGLSSSVSPFGGGLPFNLRPVKFQILNGNILGLGGKPILNNLEGVASFSDSTLTFRDMKGDFLGLPVLVGGKIKDPFNRPVTRLSFKLEDKHYKARFAFRSGLEKCEGCVIGYVEFFDTVRANFKGRVNITPEGVVELKNLVVRDFLKTADLPQVALYLNGNMDFINETGEFIIRPETGFVKISGKIKEDRGLQVYSKFSHINFFGLDMISQMNLDTSFHRSRDSSAILRGTFKTQNLILNYKPFKEIEVSWVLKNNKLVINSLELGGEYRLFGKLLLAPPYDMDLSLKISNAYVSDLLIFSDFEIGQEPFSGVLNGSIRTRGPIKNPESKGEFEFRDGNLGELNFDVINFGIKGKGPVLKVSDSRIFKEGGFLYLGGEVDLSKLGKRNIFENLKVETDQRVIVWEGWDISKDSREVKLSRPINEDFDVKFKTYVPRESMSEDQKKNEIGIEYKIKEDDSINIKMQEDSAFVGVEHKIKF